jgi:hypothetical protein
VTAKYLLPCSCGRRIIVEPRQAGETIACPCGASVQAPTLLRMTSLEPAPVVSELVAQSSGSAWGPRNQMRLLGGLLVLAAIIGGVWLFFQRPTSRFDAVDPEQLRETAKNLPPLRTWQIWEQMKQGLDRRIDQQYVRDLYIAYFARGFVIALALVGITLIAVGTMGIKKPLTASG